MSLVSHSVSSLFYLQAQITEPRNLRSEKLKFPGFLIQSSSLPLGEKIKA